MSTAGTIAQGLVLEVGRAVDFAVTGRGEHGPWADVRPVAMPCRDDPEIEGGYKTWFKALWSPTGVYFFIDAGDAKLAARPMSDFAHLWRQDVVEVFLWPDTSVATYFELNVSPFNNELAILFPEEGQEAYPWMPWWYEGARRTRRAVRVRGGPQEPGAAITGWSAEIFIPVALLKPLANTKLEPGVTWRGDVFRIDYDLPGQARHFCWRDVGPNFHNYQKFPSLRFV